MTYKAILIDSENQTISEIILDKGKSLQQVYDAIDCSIVEQAVYLNEERDALIVDEEGYYREGLCGFYYEDLYFFYGRGVIWGVDDEGDLADVKINLDDVKAKISWVDKEASHQIRLNVLNKGFTIV